LDIVGVALSAGVQVQHSAAAIPKLLAGLAPGVGQQPCPRPLATSLLHLKGQRPGGKVKGSPASRFHWLILSYFGGDIQIREAAHLNVSVGDKGVIQSAF